MSIALTKNLYREDEVIASFQLSILRGRYIQTAYWASELLDSYMTAEFMKALKEIWLLGFGINALAWFREYCRVEGQDEFDFDEMIGLAVSLSLVATRDISYLILAGTTAPAEQVNFCMVPKGLAGVDSFFAAAILQGRVITAWRALPSIGADTLSIVATSKHGDSGKELVELCRDVPSLVIAGLCLPRGELEGRLKDTLKASPKEVTDALAEWDTVPRRLYEIPFDALYWITARGNTSVYKDTDAQMRGSLERPNRLWGSVYWDSVAEELGGWEAVRLDSPTREAFYDEHFPRDIPDEWPTTLRAKSHGRGCLQPDSEASLTRFLKTWFGRYSSAVIWGQLDAAIGNIIAKKLEDISAPIGQPVPLNLERNGRRTFTT